jgi:hypothetical protein
MTMLIAERTQRTYTTSRPAFSLGEAARIRRDLLSHKADLECPRCGGALGRVGARGGQDFVWITTCGDCRLSVVVQCRTGDLA